MAATCKTALEMSQILNEKLICQRCGTRPRADRSVFWFNCTALNFPCKTCYDCKVQMWKERPNGQIGHGKQICSCGQTISVVRCLIIEELLKLSSMRFKCSNEVRGCQEVEEKDEMIAHEQECVHRQVKCPKISCIEIVKFNDLIRHMKETEQCFEYPRPLFTNQLLCNNICINEQKVFRGIFTIQPLKFDYDGEVFLSVGQATKGTLYHWIHFLGSKNESKNYSYTLEYYSNNKKYSNVVYTGQVVSIDEPSQSLIGTSDKCFGINYKVFKLQFLDDNYTFKYSVKMSKVKEELKKEFKEEEIPMMTKMETSTKSEF